MNDPRRAVGGAQIVYRPDGIHQVDFGKIRARLFPVGVQRLVAAVIQRLAGVQAGDFKIPVEDIATSGEDQRV